MESNFIDDLNHLDWDVFDTMDNINTKLSGYVSNQHILIEDKLTRSKPAPWITPELKALYYRRDWAKQKVKLPGRREITFGTIISNYGISATLKQKNPKIELLQGYH